MNAPFEIEKKDHLATLWLSSPARRNAMGPDFWRDLPGKIAELDADPKVRAVVVAARGDHFSVGLDLVQMGAELGTYLAGGLAKERMALFDTVHRLRQGFDAMVASRKPFIAAVHGVCIGGGLDMIAACDVRICDASARFSLREARIAIVADMGSLQRLGPIIGDGHLRELALTAKDIDAARAQRIGLVNDVYGTRDELFAAATEMAQQMADNSPLAVQGSKEVLNMTREHGAAVGLRYVAAWNAAHLASRDIAEAMQAFVERRKPSFTGE